MRPFSRFLGALNGQPKRATIMPHPGLEQPEGIARMPTGEVPLDGGPTLNLGQEPNQPFDLLAPAPKRTKSQVQILGAAMKPQGML